MLAMARRNASNLRESHRDDALAAVTMPMDVIACAVQAGHESRPNRGVWRLKTAMLVILFLWLAVFICSMVTGSQLPISAYTI